MPRRCSTDPRLPALVCAQDGLLTRDQALDLGLTPRAISHRLAAVRWRVLLPSVYLTNSGSPTRRQRLQAALLYAGDGSAVDSVDACRFHGVRAVAIDDARVHVLVPWGDPVRSHDYVRVRRTTRPFEVVSTEFLRYVDAPTAVIAAGRAMREERRVLALFSDAVQRGVVTHAELLRAHVRGPRRGSRLADAALQHIGAGTRSAPEARFRELAEASLFLPDLLYNCALRLPNGRIVVPDALDVEAALVHETNGRGPHEREDLFDSMQERHDAMTVAGLTVLHNSPRRIYREGYAVIAEFEQCHARLAGRGLPPGVEIVAMAG